MLQEMKLSSQRNKQVFKPIEAYTNISPPHSTLEYQLHKKDTINISPINQTNPKILSLLKNFIVKATTNVTLPSQKESWINIGSKDYAHSYYQMPRGKQETPKSNNNNNKQEFANKAINDNLSKINKIWLTAEASSDTKKAIKEKEDIVGILNINIDTLQRQIKTVTQEIDNTLERNFETEKENLQISFGQESIHHEQKHFDNDIPVIKSEIEYLKQDILRITTANSNLNWEIFKYDTEGKLLTEEIKRLNKILTEMSNKNNEHAYHVLKYRGSIHDVSAKVKDWNEKNSKFAKHIEEWLCIK